MKTCSDCGHSCNLKLSGVEDIQFLEKATAYLRDHDPHWADLNAALAAEGAK